MHRQPLFILAFCALLNTNCTSERMSNPVAQCLAHFPAPTALPDTLPFFLAEHPVGNPLADSLLQAVLDSVQFASLHFGTGEGRFWAVAQFPFGKELQAALVQTEELWFGKQSLLIFDRPRAKCLGVVELAHFYGGDGGQTASAAWLFSHQLPMQLYRKTAEHGLTPGAVPEEEPQEYLRESGALYQWTGQRFQAIPNPDSLRFLQQFSLHRTW